MKTTRLLAFLTAVVVTGACDKAGDNAIVAPDPLMAYTRFVNAVADTGPTDWRFIDQLEYSPTMIGLRFRDFSPYQQTAPGDRHLRIFPTSTDINVTQQFFQDVTITLEAGKHYTIIHQGYSRTGASPADAIMVVEDAIPASVAAGNVAIRSVNLAAGLANQDVFAMADSTSPLAGSPIFTDVAFLAASAYATRASGLMDLRATATGTTTLTARAWAPAGAAADKFNNLTAVGGVTIEKSVLTAFIYPRSVAGSQAPQTAVFQAPAIVYIVDKHPE